MGEAICAWSEIEGSLVLMLQILADADFFACGIIWHSSVSLPSKMDMMDALLKSQSDDKDVLREWVHITESIRKLAAKRNQIAHRQPVATQKDPTTIELASMYPVLDVGFLNYTNKGVADAKRGPMGQNELARFIIECRDLNKDIATMHGTLERHLASLEKPHGRFSPRQP